MNQPSKLAVPLDIFPMEAKIAEVLPAGEGWQYEPKWDGFRCLAFRNRSAVELRGKSGKSLTRYFPDVVQLLMRLPTKRCVLDGELAIPRFRNDCAGCVAIRGPVWTSCISFYRSSRHEIAERTGALPRWQPYRDICQPESLAQ